MFSTIKNKMKREKMLRQLAILVAAATVVPEGAAAPIGFALLAEKDAKELVAAEPTLFSINPTVPADAKGQLQIAVTAAGLAAGQAEAIAAASAPAVVANATTEPTTFEILKNVPLPIIQRGAGTRESKYPFGKLEIAEGAEFGDAFDVPTTAKQFASTISGQNKKFSKATPPRKFTLRVIKNGVDGAKFDGVRVWRIKVPASTPATPAATAPATSVAA